MKERERKVFKWGENQSVLCVFELPVPAAEPHQSGLLAAEQTGQSYFLAGVPLSSSPQPFTVTQGSK